MLTQQRLAGAGGPNEEDARGRPRAQLREPLWRLQQLLVWHTTENGLQIYSTLSPCSTPHSLHDLSTTSPITWRGVIWKARQ